MWFDDLMNDFKQALAVTSQHKGVFVPILLKFVMHVIVGVLIVIGIFTTITSGVLASVNEADILDTVFSILTTASIFLIVSYLIYLVLWALIEVGSINLYRAAINDEKPSKDHFFEGIRTYLGKVFAGKLLIHFIFLVTSPIWMVLFVIYLIVIGIPTAGWGVLLLTVTIGAYFASWTIAIVHDDLDVVGGIIASFRLAKNHYKTLFLIMLSTTMITQYAITLLGPLGLVLGGWLIGGVLRTYFKIVIYLTYIRSGGRNKNYLE